MAEKLVDMERTAAEKKAAEERYSIPCDTPDYPYGLCISLGMDEIDKLGIGELPEIGEEFQLNAVVKVISVSESASERGDDSKGIQFQITQMGLVDTTDAEEDESKNTAQKMYGKK